MEPTRPSQVRTGYKQGADHASAHFLCWAGAHLKEDHGDEHSPEAVDHNCCDKDMVAAKRWTKLVRNSGTAGMASALIDAATTCELPHLGKDLDCLLWYFAAAAAESKAAIVLLRLSTSPRCYEHARTPYCRDVGSRRPGRHLRLGR